MENRCVTLTQAKMKKRSSTGVLALKCVWELVVKKKDYGCTGYMLTAPLLVRFISHLTSGAQDGMPRRRKP